MSEKEPETGNWGDEPIQDASEWGKPPTPTDLFKSWTKEESSVQAVTEKLSSVEVDSAPDVQVQLASGDAALYTGVSTFEALGLPDSLLKGEFLPLISGIFAFHSIRHIISPINPRRIISAYNPGNN